MSATDGPFCGAAGLLATDVLLDLYKCTRCHKEYWVEHPLCQYGSCASWADSGMDHCWYHAHWLGLVPASEDAGEHR